MNPNRLAQVGDVLMSNKFVNGYRDISGRSSTIFIGQQFSIVPRKMTEKEIADYVLKNHQYPSNPTINVDYRANDPSRAQAKFVVIEARYTGGSQREGIDPQWRVVAQRLAANGTFDPNGEIIVFNMNGIPDTSLYTPDIKFIGHMQKKVTFI